VGKHFNEDQVRNILARSLKLQEESASKDLHEEHSISIEELRAIAKDLGISPAFLGEALRNETTSFVENVIPGSMGVPKTVEFSGNVKGRMNDDLMFRIVELLREKLGTPSSPRGKVESLGNSFEWFAVDHVFKARSHKGETNLSLTYKSSNSKALFYLVPYLISAGLLIPTFILGAKGIILPMIILLSTILGLNVLLHFQYQKYAKRKRQLTKEVFQEIEQMISQESDNSEDSQMVEDGSAKEAKPHKSIDLEVADGYEAENRKKS